MFADDVVEFRTRARTWLSDNAEMRHAGARAGRGGSDSVAVFHSVPADQERKLLEAEAEWQRRKLDAGFGAIRISRDLGGAGLSKEHAVAFTAEESLFVTPTSTELFRVTLGLVLPTIVDFGTSRQLQEFVPLLLRGDTWVCQLFSEPEAGSDLASLRCTAARDGDDWCINGQKVWTSGAHIAHFGLLIARTDPDAGHRGLTAFLVPMNSPGVQVRAVRQMTGGASFNEVFLDDVRLSDGLRVGEIGAGWKVTMAVLTYEREVSGETHAQVGGSIERLIDLARRGPSRPPRAIVDRLVDVAIRTRVLEWHNQRAADACALPPAVMGSIGKLMWTENLRRTADVSARLLGPALAADTGEWGTYCWTEHVLGAPGFRIAGGSDEIQRNIIGERGLGLPKELRS